MSMMLYTCIITGVNLILLLVLLVVYIQSYRAIKAQFTLGLILFAAVFAIQKIVSLYLYWLMMLKVDATVGTSMFLLEILEFFAFSIIVWITMKA